MAPTHQYGSHNGGGGVGGRRSHRRSHSKVSILVYVGGGNDFGIDRHYVRQRVPHQVFSNALGETRGEMRRMGIWTNPWSKKALGVINTPHVSDSDENLHWTLKVVEDHRIVGTMHIRVGTPARGSMVWGQDSVGWKWRRCNVQQRFKCWGTVLY